MAAPEALSAPTRDIGSNRIAGREACNVDPNDEYHDELPTARFAGVLDKYLSVSPNCSTCLDFDCVNDRCKDRVFLT